MPSEARRNSRRRSSKRLCAYCDGKAIARVPHFRLGDWRGIRDLDPDHKPRGKAAEAWALLSSLPLCAAHLRLGDWRRRAVPYKRTLADWLCFALTEALDGR